MICVQKAVLIFYEGVSVVSGHLCGKESGQKAVIREKAVVKNRPFPVTKSCDGKITLLRLSIRKICDGQYFSCIRVRVPFSQMSFVIPLHF